MHNYDYPALYRVADSASVNCQNNFLTLMKGYILFLIIASLLSYIGINSVVCAVVSALIFLLTIGISIYLIIKRYQKKWYNLRSVAESVKTLSWRYMMCAEPFSKNINNRDVKLSFGKTLKDIIKQNNIEADEFSGHYNADEQLTAKMNNVRESDLANRKEFYLQYRIKEQRNWYSEKTIQNQKGYKFWFSFMVIIQVLAVITVLLRIAFPTFIYFPTEVLAVCASGILSWLQTKKFQELSAAYSLASLEIGTFQSYLSEINDDNEFSEFVIESENAFSREHTQWIAKRI